MNARRFRIVVTSVVILLLVGIGAFVAYDKNAPIQEVRVYELPDKSDNRPVVDQVTQGRKNSYTQKKGSDSRNGETWFSNDTAVDLIASDLTEGDGCCPAESDLAILSHSEGDDLNPVSPEVIEDARRLREWQEASALHQEKEDAHFAEGGRLFHQLISISQDFFASVDTEDRAAMVSALDEQWPDMDSNVRQKVLDMIYGADYPSRTNGQIRSDLETLRLKQENWAQRSETLVRERPVYPDLTHKH